MIVRERFEAESGSAYEIALVEWATSFYLLPVRYADVKRRARSMGYEKQRR
jgi:hypothetical protein